MHDRDESGPERELTWSMSRAATKLARLLFLLNTTSRFGSQLWLKSEASRNDALPDELAEPSRGAAAGPAVPAGPPPEGATPGGRIAPTRKTLMCRRASTETNQPRSSVWSSARRAESAASASAGGEAAGSRKC